MCFHLCVFDLGRPQGSVASQAVIKHGLAVYKDDVLIATEASSAMGKGFRLYIFGFSALY